LEFDGMKQLKELIVGGRAESGIDLMVDVARCVSGLSALGCSSGDCVAVLLRNCREQLIVTLAAQHIGAYPVQMNWHSQAAELHYVLADCGARVVVTHADLLPGLQREQMTGVTVISVRPDDELRRAYRIPTEKLGNAVEDIDWSEWIASLPAATTPPSPAVESIIYTSGTTGNPKGVRRFAPTPEQVELTERMRFQMTGIDIDAGARVLVPAPVYHTAPHMVAMRALRKAECLVIAARFDAAELLATIERYRITHVYVVPTIFVRLLALPQEMRDRHDLSSLRFVLHAGGPCAPSVKRAMIDWWGPIINEYYGSTEAGPLTFCTSTDSLRHPGTVGRAIQGVTIRALNEEGGELPAGEVGEIHIRNDCYPDFTYINRSPDRDALQHSDLMATGDVGYHDEDGNWFICDRKRDLVISGGVNIYPAEIEAAILSMPKVADCVVFGIPDAEFGEALAALIEPHVGQDIAPTEVLAHLRPLLAAFKLPRVIEQRAQLPRDAAGKIRKRILRDPYWEGAGRRI